MIEFKYGSMCKKNHQLTKWLGESHILSLLKIILFFKCFVKFMKVNFDELYLFKFHIIFLIFYFLYFLDWFKKIIKIKNELSIFFVHSF